MEERSVVLDGKLVAAFGTEMFVLRGDNMGK